MTSVEGGGEMADIDIQAATRSLSDLVWNRDREGATRLVADLTPADLYLVASRLDASDRSELLQLLKGSLIGGFCILRTLVSCSRY